MKIGLFTDSHYCNKDNISNRRPKLSYNKIKQAMECFKQNQVDLVICLGDLVDDCDDKNENVNEIKHLCKMILSYELPFFSLMGNHDYQNFSREEFDKYTNGAYPPFVYEKDNKTLIFLDCNYDKNGNVYQKDKIDWTDTNLPNDQMKKLEEVLKEKKRVYIFSHQNIDNMVEKNHIVKNAVVIRDIIKKSNNVVKMVIQGHYHVGNDTVIDGVKYHTLKATCQFDEGYFEIIEI